MTLKLIILCITLLTIGYYIHDYIETPIINNICEYSPEEIKNQNAIIQELKNNTEMNDLRRLEVKNKISRGK
jgi:hypothetical protein